MTAKNRIARKLSLKSETLRVLNPAQLAQVGGGWTTIVISTEQSGSVGQVWTTMTVDPAPPKK